MKYIIFGEVLDDELKCVVDEIEVVFMGCGDVFLELVVILGIDVIEV